MDGVVLWYILLLALHHLFHMLLCVFRFFLIFSFFFLCLFVSSITYSGIEVSLAIFKIKQWSCSQVPKWSFKGRVITASFSNSCNCPGWANWSRFSLGKILGTSYVHFPLRITCCLQSISVKLIYQFLSLSYCFLFFRCLQKVFEEERNKNKDGNSRGVTKG